MVLGISDFSKLLGKRILRSTVIAFCAIAFAGVVSGETTDAACVEQYDGNNWCFEDKMRVLREVRDFDCLPVPYSPFQTLTPYWQKAVGALFESCISDNINPDFLGKYLALGAGTLISGTYVAPYTASELKSDGVKCFMKAMVGASDASAKVKQNYIDKIDTGFAVKDWHGFVTAGVPSLKDVEASTKAARALAEFGMSAAERIGDAPVMGELGGGILDSTYQDAERRIAQTMTSRWEVELNDFHQLANECRFENAERTLKRARRDALAQCRDLADDYRRAQHALLADMVKTYRWARGLSPLHQDVMAAKTRFSKLRGDITTERKELEGLLAKLGFLDANGDLHEPTIFTVKEMELLTRADLFEVFSKSYLEDYRAAQEALNRRSTPEAPLAAGSACFAISDLRRDVERSYIRHLGEECRTMLYRSGPGGRYLAPETLEQELFTIGRIKSSEWWRRVDELRGLRQTCEGAAAGAAKDALRRDMSDNAIFQIVDGRCQQVPQPVILAVLDESSTPEHCKETSVPLDIVGMPLSEAIDALGQAMLLPGGVPDKVKPDEGDIPGTVIDSDPAPGASARRWSAVKLTVYDRFSEETAPALVAVPSPLVGQNVEDALAKLAAAGLVGDKADPVPAARIEMVPGQVHSVSPAEGDAVEKGSTVSVTPIGDRPIVAVPNVAGAETEEAARKILIAAGFVAGKAIPGDPPPEGVEPFAYYTSNPPPDTKLEMFSTVVPIYYDEVELRFVPNVSNQTLDGATAMLAGEDGFFVVAGKSGVSKERPEGTKLGRVHYTEPSAETPAQRGTVVKLFFYPPLPEEIGNVRPIPNVLGETADGARGILAGKGDEPFFTVAQVIEKDEAPEGKAPKTVYETIPEIGSPELRGTAVTLHVYKAPPEDGDGAGGSDWIGRWKVSGKLERDGKSTELNGMLEISARGIGLLMKWLPWRDGEYKKMMELPMVADQNNTLRTAPEILKSLAEKELERNPGAGSIEQALERSADLMVQVIRTLEISREGNDCALIARDPKSGPVKVEFSCIRQ